MRKVHRATSIAFHASFSVVLSLASGCGGAARSSSPSPHAAVAQSLTAAPAPAPKPEPPSEFADTDYLAVGTKNLVNALEPLLSHREARGHHVARLYLDELSTRTAHAIRDKIHQIASRAPHLRFIALVGDPLAQGEEAFDLTPLPAFYLPKIIYEKRPSIDDLSPRFYSRPDIISEMGRVYPSDLPYAYARDPQGSGAEPLYVGRIPARSAEEVNGYAKKVIAYETSPAEGTWRRRIELVGGPANFGTIADFLIESTTTNALDQDVPYDYDIRVLFPKPESPYAYPFPEMRHRVIGDFNEGALIAAYIGHGSPSSFDDIYFRSRWYEIGSIYDMAYINIPQGPPFFISITCSTGAFDLYGGRKSLAEHLVLNPAGPVAAFAASRESHPYSNALYGLALVEHFLKNRAASLGEGIAKTKEDMKEGEIPIAPLLFGSDPQELNREHEGLYNLFGDPAIVLRYAAPVDIHLADPSNPIVPSSEFEVIVSSPAVTSGSALITVETRRSKISGKLIPQDEMRALRDEALWNAMRKNYEMASNKIITQIPNPSFQGPLRVRVKAPAEPGDYIVKAFLSGAGEAAAGHTELRVAAAK